MSIRVAFFGTPAFAVPTLERLLAAPGVDVVVVITQPDRPRGRGQRTSAGPVKAVALAAGLPVLQPTSLKTDETIEAVGRFEIDLGVVAAYGKILPQRLLDLPRLGVVNVHASLLPRWRGAAPVHRAILAGDTTTGVTIMRVVLALDAGAMLLSRRVHIGPEDTSVELEARLAALGGDLLVESLPSIERHEPGSAQNDADVTYAARLERADGVLRWDRPAQDIHNQVRGLHPWPLASTWWKGRRVILLESSFAPSDGTAAESPGTVLGTGPHGFDVAASPGVLSVRRVQLEGRAAMPAGDFVNGYRLARGERFELPPVRS